MGYVVFRYPDARIDSRESFAIETLVFIARQADSHESLSVAPPAEPRGEFFFLFCGNFGR